jgi:hypothetical protein
METTFVDFVPSTIEETTILHHHTKLIFELLKAEKWKFRE